MYLLQNAHVSINSFTDHAIYTRVRVWLLYVVVD